MIRLESGESTQLTNLIRVVRALGLLGNLDAFVPPAAPEPAGTTAHARERASARVGRREEAQPVEQASDRRVDMGR